MRKDFVLSVSYGNYLINHGGTDKVIREHEQLYQAKGISYLFLFPVGSRGTPSGKSTRVWGVNLDGHFLGLFTHTGVRNSLIYSCGHGLRCKGIFIHHLWRVDEEALDRLLDAVDAPIYYYLHDLRAVCNNHNNNNCLNPDHVFCGFGIKHKECAENCQYKAMAQNYRVVFREFLQRYSHRINMIAPSKSVKRIYATAFTNFENCIQVIPHQRECGAICRMPRSPERKLKVAFVGAQNVLKGWDQFKLLLKQPGMTDKYEFYYMGGGLDAPDGVTMVDVSVQRDGQDAMVNALKSHEIDIALLLSCWPETYSYTYFESYAAGCYVVTLNVSGNIADMVIEKGNGVAVASTEELMDYFADPHRVRQEILTFEHRSKELPQSLVQNPEILELVENGCDNPNVVKLRLSGRRHGYEVIYRFINRKKLPRR